VRHDPALDGLRGVAIAVVVARHFDLLPGGWIGVSLFFALSGFLITSLLLDELQSTGGIVLRAFYRRRVARLAPALLLALTAMWFLWQAQGLGALAAANALIALVYLANVVRAFAVTQMTPASWAWSLSLEEQFYALWPLALRGALRRTSPQRLARLLVLASMVFIVGRVLAHDAPSVGYTLVRGDELLLGAALALAPRALPRWVTVVAALGFVTLLAAPLDRVWISVTAASLCSVALVASVDRLRPFLTLAPLRYLGRISYALYLWNGVMAALPGMTYAWLLLSFPLAIASTHWVEEPLRRRLGGRPRQRPQRPSEAALS